MAVSHIRQKIHPNFNLKPLFFIQCIVFNRILINTPRDISYFFFNILFNVTSKYNSTVIGDGYFITGSV